MASKDIEKLKEKFDKDPNSKLFLPLAEEYRKEGMLEEAIEVLQKGLEKHVTYTSARVLLGKTYLEKGMIDEARGEFESVIKIVPDNLFAQKKLAELYRDTGETALAVKALRAILKLNPMDDEALGNLRDIEAALSPAPPVQEARQADSSYGEIRMPGAAVSEAEEPADMGLGDTVQPEVPDIPAEHSADELNAFKDSLFGDKSGMGDEVEHAHEIQAETGEESEEAGTVSLAEDEVAAAEDWSLEDIGTAVAQEISPAGSEPLSSAEDEVAAAEDWSLEDIGTAVAQEISPAGSEPLSSEQDPEETIELAEEPFGIADEVMAAEYEEVLAEPKKEREDFSGADRFLSEGKFTEAMGVYRRILANDPDNKRVLQRVEELRSLLKLMGKDKAVLIDKLNAFLEGIHKRRDGFLRHS